MNTSNTNEVKNKKYNNNIDDFISKNKSQKGSKTETHQAIYNDYRINFIVKNEEYDIFMKIYRMYKNNNKDTNKEIINIMEKSLDDGPLYFDFDIKMLNSERLFNDNDLIDLVSVINKTIKKYYVIDDVEIGDSDNEEEIKMLKSYVFLKDEAVFNSEKKKYCDGIHIHYPNLILNTNDRLFIYEMLIEKLKKTDLMTNIMEKTNMLLEEVFDKGVMYKNKWWFMYKSGKTINNVCNYYKVSMILDENNIKLNLDESDKQLINILSIRNPNFTVKSTIKQKYFNTINDFINKNNIGVVDCSKFFKDNNNNNNNNNIEETNENFKNINQNVFEDVVMLCKMLNVKRATNYELWRNVGYALYNISPKLNANFHEFSKLCKEKYNYNDVENFWNGCSVRENSNYINGLEQWAKHDNPEKFEEYLMKKIKEKFDSTQFDMKTDYDLALIIYETYKHEFACSSLDKGEDWWNFSNHRWHRIEKASTLSIRLSEQFAYYLSALAKKYNDLQIYYLEKEPYLSDNYCQKAKDITSLIKKFKNKKFKQTIISEASTIFFDKNKDFKEKLDNNRYLIGFNNGVYDLKTHSFREGRAEDYITFTTGYDYKKYKIDDDKIKVIDSFIDSIMPTIDEKKYLLYYLSSILEGGNRDQLALIWTGSGANGKGTLTKLMSAVLGDYYSTCDSTLITKQRGSAGNASPHLADKKGKRWLEMSETEQEDRIETGILKLLTGEDKIQARELFKNPFYFLPQFKFTLQCNNKPELKSDDGGVKRRVRVLNFPMKFVNEPKLKNERKKDNKLEQRLLECKDAFVWLLLNVYYKEYSSVDGLEVFEPLSVKNDSAEYMNNSNIIKTYIEIKYNYTEQKKDKVNINDLWNEYMEWHKVNYPCVKQPKLPKLIDFLKNQDLHVTKTNNTVYGLSLKEFTEEDENF
jgi:P4 family phage/plasmid primase-like protien